MSILLTKYLPFVKSLRIFNSVFQERRMIAPEYIPDYHCISSKFACRPIDPFCTLV